MTVLKSVIKLCFYFASYRFLLLSISNASPDQIEWFHGVSAFVDHLHIDCAAMNCICGVDTYHIIAFICKRIHERMIIGKFK